MLKNGANKVANGSKAALGSAASGVTNTASKIANGSKAAISSSGAFINKTSSQIGLNANLFFNTISNNMMLFGSIISVGFIQIIGIAEKSTRGIAFAFSAIISLFILFFVSLFPLITQFSQGLPITLGNIFSYIFNPVNNFFILLIQTLMNFFEAIIIDAAIYTGKKTEEAINEVEITANNAGEITQETLEEIEEIEDVVEGYTTCINATGDDIKEISTLSAIETKKVLKDIILVLTSFITFIYLSIVYSYGLASSSISGGFLLLYFGLLSGYLYLKYELHIFYKYFTTDDFNKAEKNLEKGFNRFGNLFKI
mgnify:CR=1 FL=1|jgi:hypothetical protein